MKVGIIGSGAWGTAICNLIKRNGFDALLFSRHEARKLQEEKLDILFLGLRTDAIKNFVEDMKEFLPQNICSLSKGIYCEESPFLSDVLKDFNFAILSGPNFADEVESQFSAISTIASEKNILRSDIKKLLENKNFAIEETSNIKVVECYGIFKNIIAIYMGIMFAKNICNNTRSKIFTILIQEMQNFIKIFDKTQDSFFLSCGIGDIFLTASGSKSRNFSFGLNFGLSANQDLGTVEGVRSLHAIPVFEKIYGFKFDLYKKLYNQIVLGKQEELC